MKNGQGTETYPDGRKYKEYNDLIRRLKDEDIETGLIEEIRREQTPEDSRKSYQDCEGTLRKQGYKPKEIVEIIDQATDEITAEDIEWYDKNTVREQLSLFEYETKPGEKTDVKFQPSKPPKEVEVGKTEGVSLQTRQYVRMSDTHGGVGAESLFIRDMGDVASVLSIFKKDKQENVLMITVDKDGKVLELHHYARGYSTGAPISATELAGHVLNVPGAHTSYFIHNHPSGNAKISPEDHAVYKPLESILKLNNIEFNALVVAGNMEVIR